MGKLEHTDGKTDQELGLTAIRIAEGAARSAERSSSNVGKTLRAAEASLKASEERMAEVSAAAAVAAGEATEARMRADSLLEEFRALEARIGEHLRVASADDEKPTARDREKASVERTDPITEVHTVPAAAVPPEEGADSIEIRAAKDEDHSQTAEFESVWSSFDGKADRILERLNELEAR